MATKSQPQLTLQGAHIALAAAQSHAKIIGVPMNIAIVDASTNLIAFERMDGAKITSISIAMDKAFTAAGHRVGTHTYKDAVWPGGPAYGIGNSNGGRFTTFGGGLPVKDAEGRVVGGIGASTGTPAQDQEVVQAGVDALEKVLRGEGKEGKSKL
ncbi:GlcG-like protein [Glarea lozoyensis ATCC 20868]|uniref:GlcG-like protein n=1 Tax=Glarea lozoyensis (strain ATCC 20868 / MF5171) TaxID=1116229 RepID=S3D0Q7_GLAL2|nr:GlcG-like protein [Glarea lozoyensis ATCC 20868]EPE31435.1 GlcG-like protein [Glarea lozoyensis ATCC 20868]